MRKNNTTTKQTHARILLLSAFAYGGTFTPEEMTKLKHKAWSKSLDSATITAISQSEIGQSVLIFDFYVIEKLSLVQRIRHCLRKFRTAVVGYMGINSVVVVITQ